VGASDARRTHSEAAIGGNVPSQGWETAGPHPEGEKKVVTEDGSASVQLKRQTAGKNRDQIRLYGWTPAGRWFGVVLGPHAELLGHGVGETKKEARGAMLSEAGLSA